MKKIDYVSGFVAHDTTAPKIKRDFMETIADMFLCDTKERATIEGVEGTMFVNQSTQNRVFIADEDTQINFSFAMIKDDKLERKN